MLTCFLRSGLMVNDETPISYFWLLTPSMIWPNGAVTNLAFSPSLAATALKTSTSKPWIVLPSSARNSLGAYVESVPTRISPSLLIESGTFAASAASTLDVALGVLLPLGCTVLLSSFLLHAAPVSASATASPATAYRDLIGALRTEPPG